MKESSEAISIEDVFRTGVKKYIIFIILLAVSMLLYLGAFFLIPPKYSASGSLLVEVKQNKEDVNNTCQTQKISTLNSYIDKGFLLKWVIDTSELSMDIGEFTHQYTITHNVEYNFINISCESRKPEDNIKIVNNIIKGIIHFNEIYSEEDNDTKIIISEEAWYNKSERGSVFKNLLLVGVVDVVIFFIYLLIYLKKKQPNFNENI